MKEKGEKMTEKKQIARNTLQRINIKNSITQTYSTVVFGWIWHSLGTKGFTAPVVHLRIP
jgi:hypothetical protein